MLREQKRRESKVMIKGFVVLGIFLLKELFKYELPSEIADTVIEVALSVYMAYAIGNSPRIKGEY